MFTIHFNCSQSNDYGPSITSPWGGPRLSVNFQKKIFFPPPVIPASPFGSLSSPNDCSSPFPPPFRGSPHPPFLRFNPKRFPGYKSRLWSPLGPSVPAPFLLLDGTDFSPRVFLGAFFSPKDLVALPFCRLLIAGKVFLHFLISLLIIF